MEYTWSSAPDATVPACILWGRCLCGGDVCGITACIATLPRAKIRSHPCGIGVSVCVRTCVCKCRGHIGNFAHLKAETEAEPCRHLLSPPPPLSLPPRTSSHMLTSLAQQISSSQPLRAHACMYALVKGGVLGPLRCPAWALAAASGDRLSSGSRFFTFFGGSVCVRV